MKDDPRKTHSCVLLSPKANRIHFLNQAVVWSSDFNVIELLYPKEMSLKLAEELLDQLFEQYKDYPKFDHVVVEWYEIREGSGSRFQHRWTKWRDSRKAIEPQL